MNFKIAIDKSDFTRIDEESVPERIKNAEEELVLKGMKLTDTWITAISAKINDYEGNNYRMIGRNGRIKRMKQQLASNFSQLLVNNNYL